MTTNMTHAEAAKRASEARAEYDRLSIGEHPDVLDDAYWEMVDADNAEARAFKAYTNPFNVPKTVDARWPRVGLDDRLTLG